jgi:hypothetical protein
MSDSILWRIRRDGVQTLEEAVQAWAGAHLDARMAGELQDALRLCQRWPDEFEDVCDSLWRRAGTNEIEDYQHAGEGFLELVDRALQTLQLLAAKVQEFEGQGTAVAGAAGLRNVQDKLRRFRQQFLESWLWMSEAIREEARAEYARGDYRTVEEILDGLQGPNP